MDIKYFVNTSKLSYVSFFVFLKSTLENKPDELPVSYQKSISGQVEILCQLNHIKTFLDITRTFFNITCTFLETLGMHLILARKNIWVQVVTYFVFQKVLSFKREIKCLRTVESISFH